ncbi:amino acid adenylation domain-containing protein [Streptomyces anulatus]|uniref:amino acid adenylation domain-containing protein n=1 Tax=Streptomyces anulatus TaxID=1892 RepID=UPI0036ADDD3A
MTEHADPVFPVLWNDGPPHSTTAPPVRPHRTAPGDFAAAVLALATRYTGRAPAELLTRAGGAGEWTAVAVQDPGPAATLGTRRDALSVPLSGTPVEVALGSLTFRFEPMHDGGWATTVSAGSTAGDDAALGRIAAHVNAFLAAPDELSVGAVDHRTEAERTLFAEVNRTAVALPEPGCLHRQVERVVDAAPERIAVVQGEVRLSYGRLDAVANALAERLGAHGVGPGGRVGVVAARSVDMVVAAYAALKAGASYVPLDPMLPPARQAALHRIGEVDVIVTESGHRLPAAQEGTPVIALDPVTELPATPRRPEVPVRGDDLAYTIFTSGSSGEPKGVLLDHVGRTSMILDLAARIGLTPDDRILAVSSPSFDMTVLDMFAALMTGAAVVMPERGRENDIDHWVDLVAHNDITVWHSVPSTLELFLNAWGDRTGSLRAFLLGGDWIPLGQPQAVWKAFPGAHFVSLGGASEVSVDSTYYIVASVDPSWRSIPYGRPMTNQNAYVLDAFGRPAAVDQVGELYLGGAGVGWGYQSRAATTAEKFQPDPFRGVPGARMYRTGDLARLRRDGELELLGRVDQQVKVGGVRIEVGEIEACLREHTGVGEAVVVAARDTQGRPRSLTAYVVPASPAPDTVDAVARSIREHLAARLPAAMVPARIEVLDALPVNSNGKIARRELEQRAAAVSVPAGTPDDELLTSVGQIWREVLGLDAVPAADESFAGLGGGSLAAIQVSSRLNRRFATDIKVADLLGADTVALVAQVVTARRGERKRPALVRRR